MILFGDKNSPPQRFFKAFRTEVYAENFLRVGEMRVSSLESFRKTEDVCRRDKEEGKGCVQYPTMLDSIHIHPNLPDATTTSSAPGLMSLHVEPMYPVFIYSVSDCDVSLEYLRTKYGPFVVEVFNPKAFLEAIDRTRHSFNVRGEKLADVHCLAVAYDKGEVRPAADPMDLVVACAQKSKIFAADREWRIVYRCFTSMQKLQSGSCLDHTFIYIGQTEGFARKCY